MGKRYGLFALRRAVVFTGVDVQEQATYGRDHGSGRANASVGMSLWRRP